MKNLMISLLLGTLLGSACTTEVKNPVDYVNPQIGTISQLLTATAPIVKLPFGMVELCSNPYPHRVDRYLADYVYSFTIRQLPRGYGSTVVPSWIMATTGNLEVSAEKIASAFDHDFEIVTPYYSWMLLEDYDIEVEYTATEHAAYYRFTFPEASDAHILIGSDIQAEVSIVNDRIMEFREKTVGENGTGYLYAEFSKPYGEHGTWDNAENIIHGSKDRDGNKIGAYANYSTSKGEQIEVRIGVSHIDVGQARQNLKKEIPEWGFEEVKNKAKRIWNESLGKISVEGGTEKERSLFYTALYRVLSSNWTINLTEFGRYAYENKVYPTEGSDFYRHRLNWGCREMEPLLLMLYPEKQNDRMRTYLRMEEHNNYLSRRSNRMIGHHETVAILDAYRKGFRDFDMEKAYEAMKKYATGTTMLTRARGDLLATELDSVYYEKGFFPALPPGVEEWVPQVSPGMRRNAVSITLENCYDDWALAEMAKILNKTEDYEYFMKRAGNYRNVFDPVTGFMRPKTADGKWIEPFDPIWSGGKVGRDYYTENNAWSYLWYVPHDFQGLTELLGGREKVVDKLDLQFNTVLSYLDKHKFLYQFADMTGLSGMYTHGNENARFIPYLYNYAGAPWKTQKRVRDIMNVWYGDNPLGTCGDEDEGYMAAWYVLSAAGIYQLNPGVPHYTIGSPVFEKLTINVGNGNVFIIEAKDVSAQNKYIQSAMLNGKPLEKPWFEHAELQNGGSLVLQMGPRPNKQWGSEPEDAPPSSLSYSFQ
jgi:predicted alpha-1,2-mannosidase